MSIPLSHAELRTVVEAATLAPSVLNIQPWLFVARPGSIEVHRDPGRVLPRTDPDNRSIVMSCGAAVLNLRLALAGLGRRATATAFPDGPTSTVLARVDIGEPAQPTRTEARLRGAIRDRRTSRVPFVDQPLAPETVLALESCADVEGATLRVLDAYEVYDIGRLVREADLAGRADAELRAEVLHWTRRGPDAVDGIPTAALGPSPNDLTALVRDFALGLPTEHREHADFERDPVLAVLLTDRDGVTDWLAAGQALERVWLEATAAGLAVSLLMQPLELPSLRWLARPPRGERLREPDEHAPRRPYWPQALLRIGVATGQTPATPRRPLAEVLSTA